MKIENILVVYKKSILEIYTEKGQNVLKKYIEENDASLFDMQENHNVHNLTLNKVKRLFDGANIVYRGEMNEGLLSNYKMVVAVGGDGTVLDISHYIFDDTPIFAVNSTKGITNGSEGFFCAASEFDLEEKAEMLFREELSEVKLNRMEVLIDGKRINEYALNDVLIAHSHPAAMSRYSIKLDGYEEKQRSSGIWVCTAAGSTAATFSSGGKVMPIDSDELQYVVREPPNGRTNRYNLLKGMADSLELKSGMREGMVYVDGRHIEYNLPIGSRLIAQISDEPLIILGFDKENRKKYFER
ncbi:MAG: hypothetical protein U9Q69_01085 [Nanoarchaeota archaeon]|nr:hypothetical protein [Nanoarchaeota archaeon]